MLVSYLCFFFALSQQTVRSDDDGRVPCGVVGFCFFCFVAPHRQHKKRVYCNDVEDEIRTTTEEIKKLANGAEAVEDKVVSYFENFDINATGVSTLLDGATTKITELRKGKKK